ncbi:hypothetical protein LSAT2_030103 [Lamellibrachia satsuma]|nr:hypothetical protein LSAT2_030103 [Lamellibrachia satsuma]
MFDNVLHPDKSDCRELFNEPLADKDFYPASYLEHRHNFNTKLTQVAGGEKVEGNSAHTIYQPRLYYWLAGRSWVNTICEIGFNAGHSALQWLAGNDHAKVFSFDIGQYNYTQPMADYLKKIFPGRLHLIIGDSLTTVPRFSGENPFVKCDVILVDGGHTSQLALGDLQNMRPLANIQHHVLVVDDLPSRTDRFLKGIGYAWNRMRADGLVVERLACSVQPKKASGSVVGYYVTDHNMNISLY